MKKLFTFLIGLFLFSSMVNAQSYSYTHCEITGPKGDKTGAKTISLCWDTIAEVPAAIANYSSDGGSFSPNGGGVTYSPAFYDNDKCFEAIIYTSGVSSDFCSDKGSALLAITNLAIMNSSNQVVALPIELSAFTADYDERSKNIEIRFATASQINVEMIEVLRSYDNINFERIKTFNNIEDTAEKVDYRFVDNRFGAARNVFYQLKSTDWDGTDELSKVVSVEINEKRTAINLFPNPAKGAVTINASIEGIVKVMGLRGETIISTEIQEGNNQVDISALAAGVYLLTYTNDAFETLTKRLIVSK